MYSAYSAFGYALDPHHIYRNKKTNVLVAGFCQGDDKAVLVVFPDRSKWFTKDHSIDQMVQRFM